MKTRLLLCSIALISASVPAHAQFGNLLQSIKGAVDSVTKPADNTSKPSPSAPAAKTAAPATNENDPCMSKEDTYFRCTVKGKPVGVCTNFATDAPSVGFLMGNMDKNYVREYQNEVYAGNKERFMVAQYSEGKATLTTVSLKDYKNKDITYSITECQGMECNPDKSTWLTITKGQTEMAGSGFCDANSSSGFNFPFSEDKKGNLTIKAKEYFAIQKKPFSPVMTTNKSWSE